MLCLTRALGVIASAMHCRVYVCMLWDQCVVLCIYEHGHDNVVRRLCGNIDHGIVGEPIDASYTHNLYGGRKFILKV